MLKYLFVHYKRMHLKIDPMQIVCLVTTGNYTRIHLANDIYYEVPFSLTRIMQKLSSDIFIQTHRAYVISVNYVEAIYREYLVVKCGTVPIAKQYYKSLMEKLDVLE